MYLFFKSNRTRGFFFSLACDNSIYPDSVDAFSREKVGQYMRSSKMPRKSKGKGSMKTYSVVISAHFDTGWHFWCNAAKCLLTVARPSSFLVCEDFFKFLYSYSHWGLPGIGLISVPQFLGGAKKKGLSYLNPLSICSEFLCEPPHRLCL